MTEPIDIKTAIDRARKPGKRGGGGEKSKGGRNPEPYAVIGGRTVLLTGEAEKPLCNFAATITEEILHDDGLQEETYFRIEGKTQNEKPLPAVEVPSSRFASMAWVSALWGAAPLIYAGNTTRDHLRTAIQVLSGSEIPRRTVYGHTGWRKIEGEWMYLHGGGAITADGNQAGFEVRAGEGHMKRYGLDAESGGDLAADVRATLRLLDLAPSNPGLGVALLAAVARAPLGEAAPVNFGFLLAGETGCRKSEAAAVALAHFGRFDALSFPACWEDSESDLEAKAFCAKDALFVVDDFKPKGSATDVHRLHNKADRLFRGAGNQAGRGRRTADMRQRPAYHPRGTVLATGEDIPRGQSMRARLVAVELALHDINNGILAELQTAARESALRRSMVGYLRWLAPCMDEWKQSIPHHQRAFRDQALGAGFAKTHPRAADMFAALLIGLDAFLMYAESSGALEGAERADLFERCETALKTLISGQGDYQADQDEVAQFLRMLNACFAKGACHASDFSDQGAPAEHSHFWGWRVIPAGDGAPAIARPQGPKIGWVDSIRVYLNGDAAFEAVCNLARATGENLAITQRTLWTRLYQRGFLVDVAREAGKVRLSPKRTIAGVSQRVYVMHRKTIEDICI